MMKRFLKNKISRQTFSAGPNYISINDSEKKAAYVFDKIKECCQGLQAFPSKGHCPPELDRIGIKNYKEIHFKPYRIIYEIIDKSIFIHAVLDGRRNLQKLLERRLIR